MNIFIDFLIIESMIEPIVYNLEIFMKKSLNKVVLALTTVGLMSSTVANACTSLKVNTNDGSYVYGRTLEFGIPLQSQLTAIPRNFDMLGVGIDSVPGSGINWKTKYAAVGMNALGQPTLVDGFNEKGLTGGLLNAPNTASYQKPTKEQSKNSIASYQMLAYVLTNYATVEEAKKGLEGIFVNSSTLKDYHGVVQVRMTLHDTLGKSIVVEYLDGKLVITDNPVGVMTNDPEFAWHLKNIGNYANLTPVERPPLVINGVKFAPPSSGSGFHGLPGDSLSTSRFIRALAYVAGTPKADNDTQVNAVFHIMNNFDIPPGSIQLPASNPYGGGAGGFENTEWTTVADVKNQKYYFRFYTNPTPQVFDMKKMDLNAKDIKYFKPAQSLTIQSVN